MTLPIIERRRIEAEIIKPIYNQLVARFGRDVARSVIGDAVRENAVQQAAAFRKELGENSGVEGLFSTLPLWTMNDALQIEVVERTPETLDFKVHRCRYADMYRDMGLAEIGDLLSCQRDSVFCKGIDPRIDLTRTQTIMEGASHCDFRYRLRDVSLTHAEK
jgi:hypothetical protein